MLRRIKRIESIFYFLLPNVGIGIITYTLYLKDIIDINWILCVCFSSFVLLSNIYVYFRYRDLTQYHLKHNIISFVCLSLMIFVNFLSINEKKIHLNHHCDNQTTIGLKIIVTIIIVFILSILTLIYFNNLDDADNKKMRV